MLLHDDGGPVQQPAQLVDLRGGQACQQVPVQRLETTPDWTGVLLLLRPAGRRRA